MILQKEIATISEQLGVSKSVIDKDWILGHFIAAIFNEPELNETLIFKGGTCLKKCWFEEYRFSEDLDFTSKSQELELTQQHLKFITKYVEDNTEVKAIAHEWDLTPEQIAAIKESGLWDENDNEDEPGSEFISYIK
jgi:predicted nucleotidyltransferase component of viral defense system